jgi:4-amino-4-deoxy-L-arabinose transferase-like glycosyltransferase
LLALVAALYARLLFARLARHPGHADEAFYYAVAENLADGRGFVIDYVWQFLTLPPALTHASNDYWLPLASVAMAGAFALFGKSVSVALLPGIVAGLCLAPLLYAWSRRSSPSVLAALSAAGLVLWEPNLFAASIVTSTVIYFALLATASLYCASRGLEDPRFFLPAAAAAGLAHLTRHDGVLLLVAIGAALWLSPLPRAARSRYALLGLLAYGLVLSPWLLLNYRTLGAPFPPGAFRILFVSDYEDRYAYARELSLRTYLASGLAPILWARAEAAGWNLRTLWQLGGVLWIGAAAAAVECIIWRDRRHVLRGHVPAAVFLGALFLFHTLMPFSFALVNSAIAMLPALILVATGTLRQRVRWTSLVVLLLLALGASYYDQAFRHAGTTVSLNNDVGRQLQPLTRLLAEDRGRPPAEEIVVMTRIPWEVHLTTRYRAVQIPNDDLDTILAIARRYRANYLLLPAERAALAGLYEGTRTDARFPLVATLPYSDPYLGPARELKVFRIVPPPGS